MLESMQRDGENVQWAESYVTDDAVHCIYIVPVGRQQPTTNDVSKFNRPCPAQLTRWGAVAARCWRRATLQAYIR
ncbi:DUF4242 domain-containing protein [Deinococcus rubellus]|uniref:DUF4242 domain-containing protein n=1 Tax=Deinococcus rubellus TaxID=1889240 RepID=A0ABY5YHN6_9DEIO|nr:DUF4242 domain-containing protein [Deinococcus rubellus]UWX63612.1 DUF4242 domain-containing protein [Deinococcus rubellus]